MGGVQGNKSHAFPYARDHSFHNFVLHVTVSGVTQASDGSISFTTKVTAGSAPSPTPGPAPSPTPSPTPSPKPGKLIDVARLFEYYATRKIEGTTNEEPLLEQTPSDSAFLPWQWSSDGRYVLFSRGQGTGRSGRSSDIWALPMSRLMRLAPRLPAYSGALALAMSRSAERTTAQAETSSDYPQAISDDTPEHVVAQLRQRAMLTQFETMGVEVTGIEEIDDDAMERLVNGG
jgi:hypothetical protein